MSFLDFEDDLENLPHFSFLADVDSADSSFDPIPNEVLEKIFAFCVEKSPNSQQNTLTRSQPPWTLTRVNRRWRSVALARRNLWSNIIVQQHSFRGPRPFTSTRLTGVPPAKTALRLLLARSNPLPLTIHFAPGDSVALMQAMKHLLPQLVACSPRWRDVHFVFPSTVFLSSVSGIAGKLPLLEKLHLHVHAVLHSVADRYNMFGVAPQLTHATIEGFKKIDQVSLPFTQLVEYRGPDEDWANLLKAAKKLECCWIRLSETWTLPSPPIVHHRLKTLYAPCTTVLDSLELPALTDLRILPRTNLTSPPGDLTSLTTFLQRSGCKLTKLVIDSIPLIDNKSLEDLFECLFSLQHLHLLEGLRPNLRWSLLCNMLTPHGTTSFLPHLESLTLYSEEPGVFTLASPEVLSQLLKSRIQISHRERFELAMSSSLLPLGVKSLSLDAREMSHLKII